MQSFCFLLLLRTEFQMKIKVSTSRFNGGTYPIREREVEIVKIKYISN